MLENKKVTPLGLVHLSVVYVVWGSTYLAIRVAVREGAGFPPFLLGTLRLVVAGILLLLWGKLQGGTWKLSRTEFITLFGSGLLLWVGGNGLVMLAEQKIESGLTALILATTPIWVSLLEAVLDGRSPSTRLILSLLVGFLGIAGLSIPVFQAGVRADITSILAVVLASILWSAGMVVQSRQPTGHNLMISSGFQQLIAGAAFGLLTILFQEPLPAPDLEAWLALGYLLIFGSLLAFTSFVTVLKILPTRLVITHSYVNPVIAVLLGWLVLGEAVTWWVLGGAVLVLLGVAGVFWEQRNLGQQEEHTDQNRASRV